MTLYREKIAMNVMKIEISFLAALLLVSSDLLARVAVQGVEQALLSAAIEWCLTRFEAGRRKFFSGA